MTLARDLLCPCCVSTYYISKTNNNLYLDYFNYSIYKYEILLKFIVNTFSIICTAIRIQIVKDNIDHFIDQVNWPYSLVRCFKTYKQMYGKSEITGVCKHSFIFHVCKHPSPCDVTMSWCHIDINCNSMWFTACKLSISENSPCRSRRCPTYTNNLI